MRARSPPYPRGFRWGRNVGEEQTGFSRRFVFVDLIRRLFQRDAETNARDPHAAGRLGVLPRPLISVHRF
jgi:hypothetical protein